MMILVIEDNRSLAANIIEYLEAHGFECDFAHRGDQGFALAQSHSFDAVILDIMLPGLDGMSVCKKLREQQNDCPVLMLTARDTLEDKLEGFTAGTDDYLVKPFALSELLARLQVLIRRSKGTRTILQAADLKMDLALREVSRAGQSLTLNRAGWKILEILLRASPKVVTRREIEQLIWPDQVPDSDVLKSHIYQLRLVVDKPFAVPLIQTVRGVGLVLKSQTL
nr:response regulator transcription factor [Psychromonas aquimarina]